MNGSKTFKSTSMKTMLGDHQHLFRNGLSTLSYDHFRKTSSVKLLAGPSLGHVDGSLTTFKTRKLESLFTTMNKLVKQKFSFLGGAEKIFRRIFNVREGEQLVRASYCCLSTTAGPIAGRLFISTEKLSFCSDRAIAKVSSPTGEPLRFHYKIVIPLRKIERLSQSENVNKPSQKYLQVVTRDDFEFWFMGFRSYNKTLNCLQLLAQAPKLNLLTSASSCYC